MTYEAIKHSQTNEYLVRQTDSNGNVCWYKPNGLTFYGSKQKAETLAARFNKSNP